MFRPVPETLGDNEAAKLEGRCVLSLNDLGHDREAKEKPGAK